MKKSLQKQLCRVKTISILTGILMSGCINAEPDGKTADFSIIPYPQSVTPGEGSMEIAERGRIISDSPELKPLTGLLAEELFMVYGIRMKTGSGKPEAGDILLTRSTNYTGEAYDITVDSYAEVKGGTYGAIAMGTVSLLQAVTKDNGRLALPKMEIDDEPQSEYRAVMIDVARKWHSIDTLEQLIVMCRVYKVRYMQLHLTDDQSFTFPSTAYQKLATKGRHYTIVELKELVKFADVRGVTLIPEFDAPGHTGSMRAAMPALFGKPGLGVVDMANEKVYDAFETIISEMCEVFASSPYFHIGADEAWLGIFEKEAATKEAVKKYGYDNAHDLYMHFIVKMHDYAKKNGKQTLMWESFQGTGSRKVQIPKDIIVMAWETMYQEPQSLLDNGYTIINVSWKPMYITAGARWRPEYIYGWNLYRWENHWASAPSYCPIQLEPNDKVIGGQMCSWEMNEEMEVPGLRSRLPAANERFWTIDRTRTYEDFHDRWRRTDRILQCLIRPIWITAEGLQETEYLGSIRNRQNWFGATLKLTMMATIKGAEIRYTLDGTEPTPASQKYTKPVELEETTMLKAKVYMPDGKQAGHILWTRYEHRPLSIEIDGLLTHIYHPDEYKPLKKFGDKTVITVNSAMKDGEIRYTLNGGTPTKGSSKYSEPVNVEESATFTGQYFDSEGQPRGETLVYALEKADYRPSLSTGKPVSTSFERGEARGGKQVVDGLVDRDLFWDGGRAPQWLQIDLEKAQKIKQVDVCTYWDGGRYYQFTVEVSKDGKAWKEVADRRANTETATEKGYTCTFDPVTARYVKVTMLKNSANPGMHLTEVRVF